MSTYKAYFYISLIGSLFIFSCQPYNIITDLERPIAPKSTFAIGPITDGLPDDMDIDKKPTLEEIELLKTELINELNDHKSLDIYAQIGDSAYYEINGVVYEFARGSGTMRFLFGSLAGNARLKLRLQLEEKKTSEIVFEGDFWATIGGGDWITSSEAMFQTIAHNFAKALEKQNDNLIESKGENNSLEE